jgi:hypothetical protein
MNAPASAATQSPLEAALHEVHATIAELLLAADEQYAAVVARDRARLELATRQQERLSVRLSRAESQRVRILNGAKLKDAIASLPEAEALRLDGLRGSIGSAVDELRARQMRSRRLLERSIELGRQTMDFVHRVTQPQTAYDARGCPAPRHSLLLDGRA